MDAVQTEPKPKLRRPSTPDTICDLGKFGHHKLTTMSVEREGDGRLLPKAQTEPATKRQGGHWGNHQSVGPKSKLACTACLAQEYAEDAIAASQEEMKSSQDKTSMTRQRSCPSGKVLHYQRAQV